MDGVRELLGRKVAGVPVGVFAALFAGGLLYMAIRLRPSPEATGATSEEDGQPTADDFGGDGGEIQQPVFSATPTVSQPSGVSVAAYSGPDTNELWGRRVREWLVAQGTSVDVASAVVTKYLEGQQLTVAEAAVRDKAVKQFGFPPENVDYAPVKNQNQGGPVKTQPPAVKQGVPPLTHKVKGQNDNQYSELARLYYGTNSADAITKLKSVNLGKIEPFMDGQGVFIPQNYAPKWFKATAAANTVYQIAAKNDTTPAKIETLNPGVRFPVKAGTRVRVA